MNFPIKNGVLQNDFNLGTFRLYNGVFDGTFSTSVTTTINGLIDAATISGAKVNANFLSISDLGPTDNLVATDANGLLKKVSGGLHLGLFDEGSNAFIEEQGQTSLWGGISGSISDNAALTAELGNYLKKSSNLSDVANRVTARSNLGYLVQVVQQQAAHTGSTNETTIATVQIPGGAMGANGFMRVLIFCSGTGSSNKQVRLRGGPSDTELLSTGFTTQLTFIHLSNILNQNSESSQITAPAGSPLVYGGSSLSLNTTAINTSVDWELKFSVHLTNSSDSVTLRRAVIEIIYLP